MFLQDRSTGNLLEIMTLEDLYDPCRGEITARSHAGQEMQDPTEFSKQELIFPSGESLPRCWVDANYRKTETKADACVA